MLWIDTGKFCFVIRHIPHGLPTQSVAIKRYVHCYECSAMSSNLKVAVDEQAAQGPPSPEKLRYSIVSEKLLAGKVCARTEDTRLPSHRSCMHYYVQITQAEFDMIVQVRYELFVTTQLWCVTSLTESLHRLI